MEMKKNITLSILRVLALIVLITGAIESLRLTFHVGRNNESVLLILLFVVWVVSPFVVLVMANMVSKRWLVSNRLILYSLTLIITAGSLLGYYGELIPPGMKPAFAFLVVPLVSWLFILTVVITASLLSRRATLRRNSL
jgi:hypothetical protein